MHCGRQQRLQKGQERTVGLELSPLKVGMRVMVQKVVCFPDITGKDAWRRIPTRKKGTPLCNRWDAFPVVRRANVDLRLFKTAWSYGETLKIREAVPFRQGDFP